MELFRKKEQIPTGEVREVDGVQVWMVSWNALENSGYSSPSLVSDVRKAKAFMNRDDADDFVESLKNAMKLLQCTYQIGIKVEKQK